MGVSLQECVETGAVHSAATALKALRVTPSQLLERCLAAQYARLGSGLFVAQLDGPSGRPIYVHASATPIEALRELSIWVGDDPQAKAFRDALAASGIKGAPSSLASRQAIWQVGGVTDCSASTGQCGIGVCEATCLPAEG